MGARRRSRQHLGLLLGVVGSVLILFRLASPSAARFHSPGTMNPGHDDLACGDCHRAAPGNLSQQLRANVQYVLGRRDQPADFGKQAVGNAVCLDCHERPNERHPVGRFLEPRFAEAREAIQPQFCLSCHQEHQGQRVTVEPTYCRYCHTETVVENDPISISHEQLIADQRWETCLGCHDFHSNHMITMLNTDVTAAFSMEAIEVYFEGGHSPYGDEVYYPAMMSGQGGEVKDEK